MDYQLPLENIVINAFIRRKQNYALKAINTVEYSKEARRAIADISGLMQSCAFLPEAGETLQTASEAIVMLNESISGDKGIYAMQFAFDAYITPLGVRKMLSSALALLDAAGEDVNNLKKAGLKWKEAVDKNYYPVAAVIEIGKKKPGIAIEDTIEHAVKIAYPAREDFLAKEYELFDSMSGMVSAMGSMSSEEGSLHDTLDLFMSETVQKLFSWVGKKSAEIEADEVYGKQ